MSSEPMMRTQNITKSKPGRGSCRERVLKHQTLHMNCSCWRVEHLTELYRTRTECIAIIILLYYIVLTNSRTRANQPPAMACLFHCEKIRPNEQLVREERKHINTQNSITLFGGLFAEVVRRTWRITPWIGNINELLFVESMKYLFSWLITQVQFFPIKDDWFHSVARKQPQTFKCKRCQQAHMEECFGISSYFFL